MSKAASNSGQRMGQAYGYWQAFCQHYRRRRGQNRKEQDATTGCREPSDQTCLLVYPLSLVLCPSLGVGMEEGGGWVSREIGSVLILPGAVSQAFRTLS